MSSSFTVSGTTVTFHCLSVSFSQQDEDGLETISVRIQLDSAAEFDNLWALRSWRVNWQSVPGGDNVWLDSASGAGQGTLALDGFSTVTAILIEPKREAPIGATEYSLATCKFLVVS